jgi:hypothetical protein
MMSDPVSRRQQRPEVLSNCPPVLKIGMIVPAILASALWQHRFHKFLSEG